MNIESESLKPLLDAYTGMRGRQYLRVSSTLNDDFSGEDLGELTEQMGKKKAEYIENYNTVKHSLGYFSALNHEQFGHYLDNRRLLDSPSDISYQEQIARQIDEANYHFQIQAYVQIAKVCALALVLVMALTLFCLFLPTAMIPVASVLDFLLVWPAILLCSASTVISGFSGYGLFSAARKINPSAEDMISYQSSTREIQTSEDEVITEPLSFSNA